MAITRSMKSKRTAFKDDCTTVASVDNDYNSMVWITMDLVFEILLRLPVKPLLRFKSICKTWSALIQNPYFIKCYHEMSKLLSLKNPSTSTLLVLSYDNLTGIHSVWLHYTENTDNKPNSRCVFSFGYYIDRLGIVDGLFCAMNGEYEINICNPTTGGVRKIPQFIFPRVRFDQVYFGFGLHDNDYKLFRIIHSINCLNEVVLRAEFYSMNNNIWKEIAVKTSDIDGLLALRGMSCNGSGLTKNGVFYWGAYNVDVPCVLYFEMNGYMFDMITCPEELTTEGKYILWELIELKGELAWATCRNSKFELWVLNEKERSWTIKYTMYDMRWTDRSLSLLGFEKDNLVMQHHSRLFTCDPQSRNIMYLPLAGIKKKDHVYFFTESLLTV